MACIPWDNKNTFFELGFVKIYNDTGAHSILSEEITVSTSTDNNTRYACDIIVPIDIAPTKKKFTFTIKKPKILETDIPWTAGLYAMRFNMALFRIVYAGDYYPHDGFRGTVRGQPDKLTQMGQAIGKIPSAIIGGGNEKTQGQEPKNTRSDFIIEHILSLHYCQLDNISFGNFDGTKPVAEEMQGQAKYITPSPSSAAYYTNLMSMDSSELTV